MTRRKPKAQRKEADIRIRVTADQKRTLTEAAQRAGLGVSTWLLMLGLREANAQQTSVKCKACGCVQERPADHTAGCRQCGGHSLLWAV